MHTHTLFCVYDCTHVFLCLCLPKEGLGVRKGHLGYRRTCGDQEMAHQRGGWRKGGAVLLNAKGGRISDGELSVWQCTEISDSSTQVSTTELLISPTHRLFSVLFLLALKMLLKVKINLFRWRWCACLRFKFY